MNLTVANSLQSVIAFGYCNTGMKLFICRTAMKWINSCASSLPVPVALSLSFHVCSFGLRFICVVPQNLSVCFACSFSRCIPVRHRSLILSLSTCSLSVHLQDCKQEAALSAKIRGQRAKFCHLFFSWKCGPVLVSTLRPKTWTPTTSRLQMTTHAGSAWRAWVKEGKMAPNAICGIWLYHLRAFLHYSNLHIIRLNIVLAPMNMYICALSMLSLSTLL